MKMQSVTDCQLDIASISILTRSPGKELGVKISCNDLRIACRSFFKLPCFVRTEQHLQTQLTQLGDFLKKECTVHEVDQQRPRLLTGRKYCPPFSGLRPFELPATSFPRTLQRAYIA